MTTGSFGNEESDKRQSDIYIQFSFSAKEDISDVQICSRFLVKE